MKRRRRICQHQKARSFGALAGKHRPDNRRVPFGIAAAQVVEGRDLKTKVLRLYLKGANSAVMGLRDKRLIGYRDFIKSICSVNNPGAFGSQQRQRMRQRLDQTPIPNADDLPGRARGIRERSKQIESRLHAKLAANSGDPRGRAGGERQARQCQR